MKNFYLKGVIDGRKTNISASSNKGMGLSLFVKDKNNESMEVVYINCMERESELEIKIFIGEKQPKTLIFKKD